MEIVIVTFVLILDTELDPLLEFRQQFLFYNYFEICTLLWYRLKGACQYRIVGTRSIPDLAHGLLVV